MAEEAVCCSGTADGGGGAAHTAKSAACRVWAVGRRGHLACATDRASRGDEKFSPPCLKCRTRAGRRSGGRTFRGQDCLRVLPGRPAWPFSVLTGPSAAQCSFFSSRSRAGAFCVSGGAYGPVKIWRDLERFGESEKPGKLRRSAALVLRQAPVRASEKRCCPRFWHEKRDGPQKVRPRKFLLQDRITSSCPCCSA